MSEFDHEKAAKEDILARPDIKGDEEEFVNKEEKQEKAPLGLKMAESAEPDPLEQSAGEVFSRTFDEIKVLFGAEKDAASARLLKETSSGLFAAFRLMTGNPFVPFAISTIVLVFSVFPPVIRWNREKKKEKENQ